MSLGTSCASVNDKRSSQMPEKHDHVIDCFDWHLVTPDPVSETEGKRCHVAV